MRKQQLRTSCFRSYPGLVPHPVLLFLEEGWTGDSPSGRCSSSCVRLLALHPPLPMGNTAVRQLIFSPVSHFLCAFVSVVTSSLLVTLLPCVDKANALTPDSSPCLYLQFILPMTGQSRWPPPHESFSFPLNCTAWDKGRNSSHTSHWKKKKSRENMLLDKLKKKEPEKSRAQSLERIAKVPNYSTNM